MAVQSGSGAAADFAVPDALPVLPLRDAVVLPLTAAPLAVAQPRSVRLVDDVMRGNRLRDPPRRNERDVEEVPEELRKQMRFIFVDDAEEVLRHALTPSAADVRSARSGR